MSVEEILAVGRVTRQFPGSKVLPVMSLNPTGRLAACKRCDHMTVAVDSEGTPYHPRCKHAAMGIPA